MPHKGADEEDYVANLAVEIIEWLGHTDLILKSDNEPAILALVTRSLELIRVRVGQVKKVSSETSAGYDSQSNGGVEAGVMLIRGIFRTLELCLEGHLQKYIPVGHSIVPWLLEHPAMLLKVKGPWSRRPHSVGQSEGQALRHAEHSIW